MTRLPAAAAIAGLAALAALVLALAIDGGVRSVVALHLAVRGVGGGLILFALAGYALTLRLLPSRLQPLRALFVLPVGAAVSGLLLTVLGFLGVPFHASLAVLLSAGVVASVLVRRGPARPALDRRSALLLGVGALAVALALVPTFRETVATVPGQNPDAHLVTGIATLLQHAPPTAIRPGMPVDQMPAVWRSKFPIFYVLGAVSSLSGLDPIEAFPFLVALLGAFVAVGFGLVAVAVFGRPLLAGALVAGVLALDAVTLHLAFHPYYNQLWGMAMVPLAFVLAWEAAARREVGATVLLAIVLAFTSFAYPLILPYPLVVLAGFAIGLRSWPALPSWSARRWILTILIVLAALAVPLTGVVEKTTSAVDLFATSSPLWHGDLNQFVALGEFVSAGPGIAGFIAVALLAGVALLRVLPRIPAQTFAVLLGLCALADARIRSVPSGAYFDFKHLSLVGAVVLMLAAITVAWLLARRRLAPVLVALALLSGWVALALSQVRRELGTGPQVTAEMRELGRWGATLAPAASIRLDIPPSGFQLWAAYFLAGHPLDSPTPVTGTTYPYVPLGTRADYSVTLTPSLARRFPGPSSAEPPPNAAGPALRQNSFFSLWRLSGAPGKATASRLRIEPR